MDITQEQTDEYLKCRDDIVYFAENYVQYLSIYDGIKKIELYPYQIQVLEDNILTAETSRQIGFSLTSHIKILHSIIFNQERTIVIYNTTRDRASHSIQSVATLFDLCTFPENFKPKFTERKRNSLQFDNHMRVMSASNITHIRGCDISELYMEEVDYYKDPIEELLHAVIPCILSHCKIWAWSCPANGNIEKVKQAISCRKNHNHYNLSWYVIPNRDSKWKRREIEYMNEERFKHEHLCELKVD